MGIDFLTDWYVILHYEAGMMGFATKNVGASAATTSVLTGSG